MASIDPRVPKPKKVFRIIARLNVGGPAVHCTQLSENLGSRGFETTLITGNPGEGEASFEEMFKVQPTRYRLVRLGALQRSVKGISDLRSFWSLYRLMRKERPDIVHTHTAKAGLLGRLAATLAGVPIIVHTFHGHVLSGYFSKNFSKLLCVVERGLAWRSSALVTLSETLRSELSDKFRVAPNGKFRIIPLGRDLAPLYEAHKFRGELREELRIPGDALLMGIIGRLVPIKDHLTLFDACRHLPLSLNWRLLVVGDGEKRQELERKASELGLGDRIHFLGWRSDLPRVYADLDLFCLSSLNEGTPLSMIESFASGCPVVATRVGGVEDLMDGAEVAHPSNPRIQFKNQGALVPSKDSVSLSQALQHFLEDKSLRQRCSHFARERARYFSSEALTDRMASLYEELLAIRA